MTISQQQLDEWKRAIVEGSIPPISFENERILSLISNLEAARKALKPAPVEDGYVMVEPKRIMQTEFGKHGNCQSACLAMMLGCELFEVPNFSALEGSNAEKFSAQGKWLNERGLWLFSVAKWAGMPWPPPKGFYIAGGASPRGLAHSVIYKDGELWHDPHPDGGGIAEVSDVDLLLPLGFRPALAAFPSPAKVDEGMVIINKTLAIEIIRNFLYLQTYGGTIETASRGYLVGYEATAELIVNKMIAAMKGKS